jgi:DNA helicase-2/ATP-dependent DNA helicase PcrA
MLPGDEDLLADLTPAQREAVTHGEGPLLVLAGAGSGKTRVITRRVAWLLRQGVRPGNLLAITFTNKAAGEMRQRVEALVPGQRLWISTFHALGARLLRQYAERLHLDPHFTIYDQAERLRLLRLAVEAANLDPLRFSPEALQAAISRAKNQLLTPEQYARTAQDFFSQAVAQVWPVYEKKLREANALDFDDLLLWPALALKNDPELRAELDARFRFILVDEYQDTNKAQYVLLRALSLDQPNLCVVGDPDQSIYAFRGSDIRNILDFERDFPAARVITLERNYRSTKAILHAASTLIAHNRQRKPKTLVTENPAGAPVTVLRFETGQEEAEGIAQRIRAAVSAGRRRWRDFAVFLRINALSRALETAFVQHQVPFQIVRGLAFYERKENRDILAYLRLLVNPRDDLSFLRIINEPPRGIGKVSLERLQEYAAPRGLSLLAAAAEAPRIPELRGRAARALQEFAHLLGELRALREAPPDQVIRQVLERSGYRQMLLESRDPEDQERLANIEELITAAQQFASQDPNRTIADFLESITLASDQDNWDEQQDSVSVMTLHAAKGLEFPVVYMVALEQGLLPHERSLQREEQLEEERRLAFVGMTRAKEELYLCHARLREFRGQVQYTVPSMFLQELPAEVETVDLSAAADAAPAWTNWRGGRPEAEAGWREAGISMPPRTPLPTNIPAASPREDLAPGVLVRHDTYGLGQVVEVSGLGASRKVRIRFPSAGERTFLADKARLQIVRRP